MRWNENSFLESDFVPRQHQPTRVTAGIGHMKQFKIRHDVLVVHRHPIELFEQIEGDMRLPVFDGGAKHPEITLDPQRLDVMPELAERGDHIVFRLPLGACHVLPVERHPAAPDLRASRRGCGDVS